MTGRADSADVSRAVSENERRPRAGPLRPRWQWGQRTSPQVCIRQARPPIAVARATALRCRRARRERCVGAEVETAARWRNQPSPAARSRRRALSSWTTSSSRGAGPAAIATRDCASWRGIARALACASLRQRRCSGSRRSGVRTRRHGAYAPGSTGPANWRFRWSSPSDNLRGAFRDAHIRWKSGSGVP
jgi:hypothetical protein